MMLNTPHLLNPTSLPTLSIIHYAYMVRAVISVVMLEDMSQGVLGSW